MSRTIALSRSKSAICMSTHPLRRYASMGLVVALGAIGLVAVSAPASRVGAVTEPAPSVADNRLVVGLAPTTSTDEAVAIAQDAGVTGAQVVDDHTIVVDAPAGGVHALQADDLRDDDRVTYVEPNYLISGSFTPNDPSFPSLATLQDVQPGGVQAQSAWDTTLGLARRRRGNPRQRHRRDAPGPGREPLEQPSRHRRVCVRHPRLQHLHEAVHQLGSVRPRDARRRHRGGRRQQRARGHRRRATGVPDVARHAEPAG